ncbi:MAG: hypothetical protein AUH78_12930 [Gemmatimonadetes bacterium 13_1_40CM_4_69_8]|nr:MAG: hypothetical protein AUH45_05785 [Gemmatimonadetes bacterium 13_1_40CM_69_22]OLC73756.1 MAG: hypothetical protein AUH78_12930 [Gemmatimonadetes bacterium 13_1_40CM_4_69_8]
MKVTRLSLATLFGTATVVVLSCGEPSPVGVAPPVPPRQALLGTSLLQGGGLLTCSPLAYDSVTATIGPDGGTIRVGPHALAIPAGALGVPTTITAVVPSDTVNAVRFQPEGLQFDRAADLTLSYANCNLLGSLAPKHIVHTTDALQILEYLPTVDDLLTGAVTGQLQHFSDYAIAW